MLYGFHNAHEQTQKNEEYFFMQWKSLHISDGLESRETLTDFW